MITLSNAARKLSALSFAACAFVASAAMAADSDASATAATAISGSSTGILTVQNAVIGIVVLGVVFAFIKGAIKR